MVPTLQVPIQNHGRRGYTLTNEFFILKCASADCPDFMVRYEYDSVLNGLKYDRHLEGSQAEAFVRCIEQAGTQFLETPMEVPYIPNWNRVASAVPNVFELLADAVEEDNKN
jgi:hypothetical protein